MGLHLIAQSDQVMAHFLHDLHRQHVGVRLRLARFQDDLSQIFLFLTQRKPTQVEIVPKLRSF